jgi:hypothetical protein
MPRWTIREARELLDKVLVAPEQRRWLEADLERVVNGDTVQVGEQAQAVAGELLPRASRTQERSLDLVAAATGPAQAGAEPPDRPGRRPGEARRAKKGAGRSAERGAPADRAPRAAPGAGGRGSGGQRRGLLPADMPSGMAPHVVGRSSRASRRSVWRSNTAGEG